MVRRTSPLSPALHPDQRLVADPGGALVRLPSDKQIKRGTQGSTRAPEDTLREYSTKAADNIVPSTARYCQRVSGSGHYHHLK